MKTTLDLKGPDETLDTFYQGRVLVLQKKRGYRFAVDAPLLASFVRTEPEDELLELGTGSGIVSLLLCVKPFLAITALEVQDSLADLARRNVQLNSQEGRILVVLGDLRDFDPGKKFDVIFSNPPYLRRQGGALSSSEEKSIAKHELKCDIFDIMRRTRELLKEGGRAYFIFSTRRERDLEKAMDENHLKLKTARRVHPREGSPPNFFLAECRFSSPSVDVKPPLYIYGPDGAYTAEVQRIFAGGALD